MKIIELLTVCLFFFSALPVNAASIKINAGKSDSSAVQTFSFSNKNIEKILGRKLSWKEKAGLFFYKNKITSKHSQSTDLKLKANHKAVWGFVLMLLGICPYLFLLEIPAYFISKRALKIEKSNPGFLTQGNKRLAEFGKSASLVLIILALLFVVMILCILSNFSLNFNWPQ